MAVRFVPIFLLILLYGHSPGLTYAHEFMDVKTLIQQNNHEAAYQILISTEANHMGETEYDLLLARTAFRSAHYHEAIFAYERILIIEPENQPVRVELAIIYFRINELETARQLLNQVLLSHPPARIEADIQEYLKQIDATINSRRHALSTELELKQGWDSNINSATNESAIDLTVGTYRPTEGVDKETSDSFTELGAHLHYNYNFNINSRLFSSIGYSNRDNNHKSFDTQTADFKMGYSQQTGLGRLSFPLSFQVMWLDEKQLREITTVSSSLNRSDKTAFTDYSLQYGEIRYPGQTALNVDFAALSFAFGITDEQTGFGQQYALFYGDETPTDDTYQFNAREYHGLQVRFPFRLGQQHVLAPKAVYQYGEYKQRHPFFKQTRQDTYTYIEVSWSWYFAKNWRLTTQAGHTDAHSTVAIYTHTRNVISTGIIFSY